MSTPKEMDKNSAETLYELLIIQKKNAGYEVIGLDIAINKVKSSMNEVSIAWVEKLVAETK